MTQKITVSDLLTPETKRNPSAFYAHLRAQEPLTYVDDFLGMGKAWIVTNYDDAIALLKDPRFTKDKRKVLSAGDEQTSIPESPFLALMQNMLMVDPPNHTRLRSLVSKHSHHA
jgi:cytochrome P450